MITVTGSKAQEMESVHRERCKGKLRGEMFLDGDNWYSNSYVCSLRCGFAVTVNGKRHGKASPEYVFVGLGELTKDD